MRKPTLYLSLVLLLLVMLSACAESLTALPDAVITHTATMVSAPASGLAPSMTSTSSPPSPTLTATEIPSFTPTQTLTVTPTPTPTHPLMIEAMRQQDYPGSEITFEETLQDGANYDRYVISYQSEGNKIYALFTVPWGETPPTGWPVIIFNHGYIPPEQYRTTERYVDYVDVLARNGYIVFRSDYRGHGESEGEAVSSYQSPAYTADVLNAVTSAKAYPDADPGRIGMWGHSMGGHITLRAMIVSDEIKAGVIWGGVVASYADIFEYWWGAENRDIPTPEPNSKRGAWRREWSEVYGSFEENPEFWASISANSYVEDLSGPIQLHHGTEDNSVPYKLSEILFEEVSAVGLPIELYLYEGDNHNISGYFYTAMQRTVSFFDEHVKGRLED